MKLLSASILALAVATAPIAANAEYSAGDEITVLQGFKAGGGSDALAQLTQPFLTKLLGVDMVNQYIPGATGAIAWTRLAKQSKQDGGTISITNTPMLMTNYIMNDAITYSIDELTPIANVVTDPGIIVVPGDSPFKTVEDLFAAAKKSPGRVTVGNSGVGGDDFFSAILVEQAADVKFQSVPFQGDGPSATAAMGGKIDASFNNLGNVYGHIVAGNLRALAIFTKERVDFLPDVPTLVEKDINVVAGSSRGYSAPAGIPEKAREQLIAAFESLKENEEFKAIAKERALVLDIVTGDDYLQMMKSMETDYKKIWKEIKSDTAK
ncbi:tripartite tricarboxylate transporter substrate binding protein [Marinobacter sp. M3C]|uniref:tripartite tricarboxylate transporter substrate binding protein n=1 Tax=Marinobacter sp. M3C TaxID=2917715 RepID=UPI00200C4DDB|nr:tripartite tricarboxylate transporter substrate binding protein [Marinobacter sp. M3C]MCL1484812.1 tripartite tricarboxylate transporter substrate binding protein [Marinobacter sp.]UQG62283.1 tripartite tricarboxylate transporter substrate binding protein [Marinobacter sp. M3C]